MVFPLLYDSGRFWPWKYGSVEPGDWLYPVVAEHRSLFENRPAEEVARRSADADAKRIGDVTHISASLMAVPLLVGARPIGLLSVQSYELNAYTPEHLEFLDLAGYQVATAIENARLFEDVQRELFERQRAEAALQELNAELEERVQERTAQMEKAMLELEAFSYSVSHDLRAPLRAIDGYTRFLLEDYASRLDDEGLVFLNNVRKSAQRMGALIEDLLNLSWVTRSELRLETTALSEMAAEILARLQEDHPTRKVEAHVQPGLTAQGDARLLRLAMQNLLDNAWKFTARNQDAPARIEFGALDKDGERVYYVRDNGAGFDMRYSHNLFKPFSRLHGVEEFEGTGIGLASVKRVIERHGGRVSAESTPGQGAVFWFTIGES
jgi:signal transduction histidine kinase